MRSPSRVSTRCRSAGLGSWAVVWCRSSHSSNQNRLKIDRQAFRPPAPSGSRRPGPGSDDRQVPYPPGAAMLVPDELLSARNLGPGRRTRVAWSCRALRQFPAIWRTVARGRPGVTGLAAGVGGYQAQAVWCADVPAFVCRVWRSRGRGGARGLVTVTTILLRGVRRPGRPGRGRGQRRWARTDRFAGVVGQAEESGQRMVRLIRAAGRIGASGAPCGPFPLGWPGRAVAGALLRPLRRTTMRAVSAGTRTRGCPCRGFVSGAVSGAVLPGLSSSLSGLLLRRRSGSGRMVSWPSRASR